MRQILIYAFLTVCQFALLQPVFAQQSSDFTDYTVHYNALRTDLLPPQVAQGYDIQRSSSRALLNITVMKKGDSADAEQTAVTAQIDVNATNLTGQRREVVLRKIDDGDGAIYYIGEFPVHNMETYRFKVEVVPDGESSPLTVEFNQQFYTE
ncbi:MAG TPA: DUF4426 domain-containing protein [Xanthomonadales bacterium]|nr:DUF4426 domain-containing protein [Xanthomonadales bacterium]